AGSGLWLMAYLIASRIFATAGGTSQNRREELIGRRGHVAAPIQGSHAGTVTYVVRGTRQSLPAVTDDEEPIPVGAAVRIRRIENNTAHVMRIDEPRETMKLSGHS